MKNKILIFFGFLTLFLLPILLMGMVSATETSWGVGKQNNPIILTQTCDLCTYVNITSIQAPDKTFLLNGEYQMTKAGTLYNYSFNQTNQIGTYIVTGHGDDSGTDTSWAASFEISYTGYKLDTSDSIIYIGMMVMLILLFVLDIYCIAILPGKNVKEDGKIIGVNKLKYIRTILIGMAWGILLAITFTASNIALAFLTNPMMGKILFTIFQIAFAMTPIMAIIWLIYIIYTAYNDIAINKMLMRGLDVYK